MAIDGTKSSTTRIRKAKSEEAFRKRRPRVTHTYYSTHRKKLRALRHSRQTDGRRGLTPEPVCTPGTPEFVLLGLEHGIAELGGPHSSIHPVVMGAALSFRVSRSLVRC